MKAKLSQNPEKVRPYLFFGLRTNATLNHRYSNENLVLVSGRQTYTIYYDQPRYFNFMNFGGMGVEIPLKSHALLVELEYSQTIDNILNPNAGRNFIGLTKLVGYGFALNMGYRL